MITVETTSEIDNYTGGTATLVEPDHTAGDTLANLLADDAPEAETEADAVESVEVEATVNSFTTPIESTSQLSPLALAEQAYRNSLDQAKTEFADIAVRRVELEAATKAIKAEEKAAIKEYQKLLNGKDAYLSNFIEMRAKAMKAVVSATVEDSGAAEAPAPQKAASKVQAPTLTDIWRIRSVKELVLKNNVREKFENIGIDTVGELVDLIEQISLGKAKWPKGIGLAKQTEVEDELCLWLSRYRDQGIFGKQEKIPCEPVVPGTEDDAEPVAEPVAETIENTVETSESGIDRNLFPDTEGWQDDDFERWANQRSYMLWNDNDLEQTMPGTHYRQTCYQDFQNGDPVTDVIHVPGEEEDKTEIESQSASEPTPPIEPQPLAKKCVMVDADEI